MKASPPIASDQASGSSAATGARIQAAASAQRGGRATRHQRRAGVQAGLAAPPARLDVPEDRAVRQRDTEQRDAGPLEQVQLVRIPGLGIEADHGCGPDAQPALASAA